MKYPIVIPSRGRWDECITIDRMPPEISKRSVNLFVPREEHNEYMRTYGDRVHSLNALTDYTVKISEKRRRMAEWVKFSIDTPEWFWMMDDDLTFFEKYEDGGRLWQMDTEKEFLTMFQSAEDMVAEEPDRFCAIGISLRQGNNNLDWPYVDNVRLIRCGLFNTKRFLACEHDRIRFMGDFDVMIQMLKMGYDNRVLSDYAQDQRATNAKGGCETTRDESVMAEVAEELAAFHPDCVRVKDKVNKTGPMAVRKDVTIYWKKARAAAKT